MPRRRLQGSRLLYCSSTTLDMKLPPHCFQMAAWAPAILHRKLQHPHTLLSTEIHLWILRGNCVIFYINQNGLSYAYFSYPHMVESREGSHNSMGISTDLWEQLRTWEALPDSHKGADPTYEGLTLPVI